MQSEQTPFPAVPLQEKTTCCIVGGGPAGAVLALLLAKQGISVVLLETHLDFDREFRGDTLHASVMEMLDQLGLAERLLHLRHSKVARLNLPTVSGTVSINVFGSLKSKFPYITVMPQAVFLTFITDEAKQYPNFKLVMGAHVDALIEEDGVVRGVQYRTRSGRHELRAELTVAADGRFSMMRKLAQLELVKTSSPIDILWFRISRRENDRAEALGARVGNNLFLIMIDRFDYWQVGCVIVKNGYAQLRGAGLEHFRQALGSIAPDFADRFEELQDWKQMSVLSVEASRLKRWHRSGLLLIGDAAHVMSPVGGVGINYAIQDAVVASNVLAPKLKAGRPINERELAAVQRQRELPTRIIQTFQSLAQRGVAFQVMRSQRRGVFAIPSFVIPILRRRWLLALPARFIAYGFCPPQLKNVA